MADIGGKSFSCHKSPSTLLKKYFKRTSIRSDAHCRPSVSLAENFKQVLDASSSAKKESKNIKVLFRTQESDPIQHNLNHEALFYTVPAAVSNMFQTGYGLEFNKQRKTFQETCIMVRKPALEIFEYIKSTNLKHPAPRIVLYGRDGTGKSITLAHVLHYVHHDGWLILHTPWPALWRECREVSLSTYKQDRIDSPIESAEWLKHFSLLNDHLLDNIQTRHSYAWSKRESLPEGKPIKELIEFGINRMKYASDCAGAVIKEMKLNAREGNLKVAVIIDGVNGLWGTAPIKREDRSFVDAENLTMVHNMKKLLQHDWVFKLMGYANYMCKPLLDWDKFENGGMIICSTDETANSKDKREDYKPVYLLGKEGFELLDPFVPIYVPEYSNKEAFSCLEYYIDRMWIQNELGRTDEGKKQLLFMSHKNPFQLMRACAAW